MIKTEPDGKRWALHAPGSRLDYGVDWSDWLQEGETIEESEWEASDGITLSLDNVIDDRLATTFAEGGIVDQNYVLTNTITTTEERVDSRTITLRCRIR